ncbi:alr0857 family protein [Aerosakkonemataceae cyanobacterium BLCC-F50]|uniref:Alr0857 family protein n=1 Tax=Floridaenema flaviceps BLCC-F50 TaxID=3153642 RepID=A0ABV4XI54_9CYAN
MLKLTYTENGFNLERLAQSLEDWVTARVILSLRAGWHICVEPSTASFLLPADLPGIERLEIEARREDSEIVSVSACDVDYVEISLRGSWVSATSESDEGVFVVTMSDRTEFFLFKLWQQAQIVASCVSE